MVHLIIRSIILIIVSLISISRSEPTTRTTLSPNANDTIQNNSTTPTLSTANPNTSAADNDSLSDLKTFLATVSRIKFKILSDEWKPMYHIGAYGLRCRSPCRHEHNDGWYSYRHCWSGQSWDYCSYPGFDYKNQKCRTCCGYHLQTSYTWCTLEVGGWGYCSTNHTDGWTGSEDWGITLSQPN